MRSILKRRQAGDTIVEVMIVLAILGSAIGISYTTASRSLLNARQAQENAEATKIAQSQIESLYTPSKITDPASTAQYLYVNGRTFCMSKNAGNVVTGFPAFGGEQRDIPDANYPDDDTTDKSCVKGRYHYSIRYNQADNDQFTVVVVWADVLGEGNDTVTMHYRIHPVWERDDL